MYKTLVINLHTVVGNKFITHKFRSENILEQNSAYKFQKVSLVSHLSEKKNSRRKTLLFYG